MRVKPAIKNTILIAGVIAVAALFLLVYRGTDPASRSINKNPPSTALSEQQSEGENGMEREEQLEVKSKAVEAQAVGQSRVLTDSDVETLWGALIRCLRLIVP